MWYISQDTWPDGKPRPPFVTTNLETLRKYRGEVAPYITMTDAEFMQSSMADEKGRMQPQTDPATGKILTCRNEYGRKKLLLLREKEARKRRLDGLDRQYGPRQQRKLAMRLAERNGDTEMFEYRKLAEGEAEAESIRAEMAAIDEQLASPPEEGIGGETDG
jgi:hypothetical protein